MRSRLKFQDEITFKTFISMTLVIGLLACCAASNAQAQNISGQISRVGETTHLEFRGRKEWNYDNPKKDGKKLSILVPPFDDQTIMQLQTWSDALIKSIKVDKNGPDGKFEIQFELASSEVESFDYLTDDPSYLIFDFYKQASKEAPVASSPSEDPKPAAGDASKANDAKAAPPKKGAKKVASAVPTKLPEKNLSSGDYVKKDRKPASSELLDGTQPNATQVAKALVPAAAEEPNQNIEYERGVFDGSDPNYERFRIKDYQVREEAIIASQQNIYIRFPMLQQRINYFSQLMKTPPIYEIKPEETTENKEARFLLTLFNKQRPGSFFTTYKYFDKKYPHSKYDEIVKNLAAEEHAKLYLQNHDPLDYQDFQSIYKYLVETHPDSVLTERNYLLLAFSALEKDDGAEALQALQRYKEKFPNSQEKDRVRIGMAEAYLLLNKPNDAVETYEDLVKSPEDKKYGIEAAFRKGDVYFATNDYKKALETYKEVQAKYPQFKGEYPNTEYNMGEAQFWLKDHKDSLNTFIDFLKIFPTHKHGSFALTRIGELLEILGADQSRVMGAFLEGYFRYPETQGSEVARVRMLAQGLKSMKEREKKRAIDEINQIAENSSLPQIKEFVTLMKAEGYSRRTEYKDALDLLLGFYRDHPTTTEHTSVFKARILRNISDILNEDIKNGKYMESLNFYGKYSTTWLKNSNRIDTQYFQAVAFEQAGVYKEAERSYKNILANLKSISGSKEEKERKVHEHLPSLSQVNLRLAAVALGEKHYREAFSHLGEIKTALLPEEEIERVSIGAQVAEQMGDLKKAIAYLEKLTAQYADEPEMVIEPELNLARLYLKNKQLVQCEKTLNQIEKMKTTGTVFSDEEWAKALEYRGDLQYESGQKLAAVESYTKLLEAYSSKNPMNSIRYRAGKILFDEGDLKGAEKLWNDLDNNVGGIYKKLAQEKLGQAEWHDTYRKYIDRIPAAKDLK